MQNDRRTATISTALPSKMDPMQAVRRFADAFNQGDVKAMAAIFAVPSSILDGLPPHVWHGRTACEDWYRDVMAASEREGVKVISSLWESRGMSMSPTIARMQLFAQP